VLEANSRQSSVASGQRPGSVLPDLAVATGDGELALERLQLEGRKSMTADEFLRGQPSIVHAQLTPDA
jgi:methionyl-tRNA formyltransferase